MEMKHQSKRDKCLPEGIIFKSSWSTNFIIHNHPFLSITYFCLSRIINYYICLEFLLQLEHDSDRCLL